MVVEVVVVVVAEVVVVVVVEVVVVVVVGSGHSQQQTSITLRRQPRMISCLQSPLEVRLDLPLKSTSKMV